MKDYMSGLVLLLLCIILIVIFIRGCSINDYSEICEESNEIINIESFCNNLLDSSEDYNINYSQVGYKDWRIYSIWIRIDGVILYADSTGEFISREQIYIKVKSDKAKPISDMLYKYNYEDDIIYFTLF